MKCVPATRLPTRTPERDTFTVGRCCPTLYNVVIDVDDANIMDLTIRSFAIAASSFGQARSFG
jgi:hypothetical protein